MHTPTQLDLVTCVRYPFYFYRLVRARMLEHRALPAIKYKNKFATFEMFVFVLDWCPMLQWPVHALCARTDQLVYCWLHCVMLVYALLLYYSRTRRSAAEHDALSDDHNNICIHAYVRCLVRSWCRCALWVRDPRVVWRHKPIVCSRLVCVRAQCVGALS
jgi:hypothetical protein